ncbi:MAG: hypothetical protein IJT70_05720 [Clostridia bacterium]|nr:hypothetical protein [Clostridia bacterium]
MSIKKNILQSISPLIIEFTIFLATGAVITVKYGFSSQMLYIFLEVFLAMSLAAYGNMIIDGIALKKAASYCIKFGLSYIVFNSLFTVMSIQYRIGPLRLITFSVIAALSHSVLSMITLDFDVLNFKCRSEEPVEVGEDTAEPWEGFPDPLREALVSAYRDKEETPLIEQIRNYYIPKIGTLASADGSSQYIKEVSRLFDSILPLEYHDWFWEYLHLELKLILNYTEEALQRITPDIRGHLTESDFGLNFSPEVISQDLKACRAILACVEEDDDAFSEALKKIVEDTECNYRYLLNSTAPPGKLLDLAKEGSGYYPGLEFFGSAIGRLYSERYYDDRIREALIPAYGSILDFLNAEHCREQNVLIKEYLITQCERRLADLKSGEDEPLDDLMKTYLPNGCFYVSALRSDSLKAAENILKEPENYCPDDFRKMSLVIKECDAGGRSSLGDYATVHADSLLFRSNYMNILMREKAGFRPVQVNIKPSGCDIIYLKESDGEQCEAFEVISLKYPPGLCMEIDFPEDDEGYVLDVDGKDTCLQTENQGKIRLVQLAEDERGSFSTDVTEKIIKNIF